MIVAYLILAASAASSSNPDDLSVQALHNFGTCVVQRAPRGARAALDLDYRSNEYDQQMHAVLKGTDYCLTPGGQMRASPVLYAGAMAEALLKDEIKPADLPLRLAYDPARAVIKARSPVEAMALCTALQAPQATAQLLEAEPTTKAEAEAISAVTPALTDCLKKDMKLELNKPALRAVLALAAWRIVTTPKVPA